MVFTRSLLCSVFNLGCGVSYTAPPQLASASRPAKIPRTSRPVQREKTEQATTRIPGEDGHHHNANAGDKEKTNGNGDDGEGDAPATKCHRLGPKYHPVGGLVDNDHGVRN